MFLGGDGDIEWFFCVCCMWYRNNGVWYGVWDNLIVVFSLGEGVV